MIISDLLLRVLPSNEQSPATFEPRNLGLGEEAFAKRFLQLDSAEDSFKMATHSFIVRLGQESISTIDAKARGHDDSMQIRAWNICTKPHLYWTDGLEY